MKNALVLFLSFLFYGLSSAQDLPDDILADQYLLEAAAALENNDPERALRAFEKIEVLDVEPPPEFLFFYGKLLVEHSSVPDELLRGQSYLKQYVLNIEKGSEHYRPTLELLLMVEKRMGEIHKAEKQQEAKARISELGMEMVLIPGGTFQMGRSEQDWIRDEICGDWCLTEPVHSVTVSSFDLGKHEVTFAQWDACVEDGGCGGYRPDDKGWGRGNRPVINVSWDDVQLFIEWLNDNTGENYRLPTESEWEYAARAGSTTEYSWGDGIGSNRANCEQDPDFGCGDSYEYTAPVGSFPANAWGLHDMHGNVSEWVQDCYTESYAGAPNDGSAWTSNCKVFRDGSKEDYNDENGLRVVRGGSWFYSAGSLGSASRSRGSRTTRYYNIGFRLAQDN